MSGKATGWAWDQDLRCVEKIVVLALADHADDAGVSWPGVDRLAQKTGQSRRTIQRALKSLEDAGKLRREERPRRGRAIVHYVLAMKGDSQSPKGARQSKRGDSLTPDPIMNRSGKEEEERGGGFRFWEATWRSVVGASVTNLLVSELQALAREHGLETVVAELDAMARKGGRSPETLGRRLKDRAAGRPWGEKRSTGSPASASRPICGIGGKPCPPGLGAHLAGCYYADKGGV